MILPNAQSYLDHTASRNNGKRRKLPLVIFWFRRRVDGTAKRAVAFARVSGKEHGIDTQLSRDDLEANDLVAEPTTALRASMFYVSYKGFANILLKKHIFRYKAKLLKATGLGL